VESQWISGGREFALAGDEWEAPTHCADALYSESRQIFCALQKALPDPPPLL
jgi:hypothetical protein